MPMKRTDKEKLANEYSAILENVPGLLVFEYHRLKVGHLVELRNKIRETGSTMRVVKNSMMRRAIQGKPYSKMLDILLGPNAVIFTGPDPVAPAKELLDFIKAHDVVKIKGGMVSNAYLDAKQVEFLAKIPPKKELFAKILGGVKAPATNILGCLKGAHQKLHGLLKAYADKLESAA